MAQTGQPTGIDLSEKGKRKLPFTKAKVRSPFCVYIYLSEAARLKTALSQVGHGNPNRRLINSFIDTTAFDT